MYIFKLAKNQEAFTIQYSIFNFASVRNYPGGFANESGEQQITEEHRKIVSKP